MSAETTLRSIRHMTPSKFTLERQTSHRYNAAWSALNDSEYVGTARRVFSRTSHNDGESARTFSLLLISSKESAENITSAIYDTMRQACRCEHDCCGHWQSSVSRVRHLGGNQWAVFESSYRNI